MSRDRGNIIHSWWIILTFTLFFNWIAFFYVGITAKHRKWIYYGIIYSIPFILLCLSENMPDGPLIDLIMSSLFILWIISIVHAFKIRKEYLMRREYVQNSGKNGEEELRRKIEREYGINQRKTPDYPKTSEPVINHSSTNENIKNNSPEVKPKLVDINNCSEQALSQLPGIGTILAKKAIEIRQTRDFESADDFGQALDLKPHIIENVRPLILTNPSNRIFEPETSGRRVDF